MAQYSTNYKCSQSDTTHMVNYSGNSTKSLHVSMDALLKKLIIQQGKVLYLICYPLIHLFSI